MPQSDKSISFHEAAVEIAAGLDWQVKNTKKSM